MSFIRGASLILSNNDTAPTDIIPLVLRIFSASNCQKFKTFVEHIANLIESGQLPTFTLDKLLTNVDKKYIELVSCHEWTPLIPSPGSDSSFIIFPAGSLLLADGSSIRKIICFNCGGVGHPVAECKAPINNTMIELRKSIMSNYTSPRDRENCENGKPRNNPNKGKPIFIPPGKGEPHIKLIDGVSMKWCGKCGCRKWNTDHSTAEHPPEALGDSANLVTPPAPKSTPSSQSTTPSTTVPASIPAGTSSGNSVSAYSASGLHFS